MGRIWHTYRKNPFFLIGLTLALAYFVSGLVTGLLGVQEDLFHPYAVAYAWSHGYTGPLYPSSGLELPTSLRMWLSAHLDVGMLQSLQGGFLYHPLMILLLAPFTWLPFFWVKVFVLLLQIAAVLFIIREIGGRWPWAQPVGPALFLLLVLSFYPVRLSIIYGQSSLWIFAFLVLPLLNVERLEWIRGLLLGMALTLKPQFVWLLPVGLLFRKAWKMLAIALGIFLGATLLTGAIFGREEILRFFKTWQAATQWAFIGPLNQSPFLWPWIPRLHITGYETVPVLMTSPQERFLWLLRIVVFVVLWLPWWLWIRHARQRFYYLILASLLLSPILWQHYLVALIPLLWFLAHDNVRPWWFLGVLGWVLAWFPARVGYPWFWNAGHGGFALILSALYLSKPWQSTDTNRVNGNS